MNIFVPAGGTSLGELDAMIHDKSVDVTWAIRIVELPVGLGTDVCI